jgi:hypothetical protein
MISTPIEATRASIKVLIEQRHKVFKVISSSLHRQASCAAIAIWFLMWQALNVLDVYHIRPCLLAGLEPAELYLILEFLIGSLKLDPVLGPCFLCLEVHRWMIAAIRR